MPNRRPRREQRKHFLAALPSQVDTPGVMDDADASATLLDLESVQPAIASLPHEIARVILDEIRGQLRQDDEGNFVLSDDQLKGVVSRTAIRGVVEATDDISRELWMEKEIINLPAEIAVLGQPEDKPPDQVV